MIPKGIALFYFEPRRGSKFEVSAVASVGASAVQRSPPETRALFERRAVLMVTYDELFLLLSLIVSIIALVYNITKKK